MLSSRIDEYKLITPGGAVPARIIDVAEEQRRFADNSLSITELLWTYDYCGIAVFEYGYFGDDENYKGRGGYGEGAGGGYKVASSKNSVNPTPSPFQGGGAS